MHGRSSDEAQIVGILARYSWAADARDVDALLELFDEDVDTRTPAPHYPQALGRGREALRVYLENGLRQLGRTVHFVGNSVIDFQDTEHATGVVYAQAHEERFNPHRWSILTLAYFDKYVRLSLIHI